MLHLENSLNFALVRSRTLILLISLLSAAVSYSQLKTVKPVVSHPSRTNLAFGIGAAKSVLYLNRNVKEDNDARGLTATLIYGGARLTRLSLEYTFYEPLDIAPTWYNVQAQTIEANIHFLAKLKSKKGAFFPIGGLSYNVFTGYFTGANDNLNLASIYKHHSTVTTRWVGLNVGTGYEHYFRPGSFYIDYKMRVGFSEGNMHLTIMDVCFSAGLRLNFRIPSVYKLFKGTRGRYFIDKNDTDW